MFQEVCTYLQKGKKVTFPLLKNITLKDSKLLENNVGEYFDHFQVREGFLEHEQKHIQQ